MDKRKIFTNTDTGLIKIIAFVTMLIDHIGYVFFPSEMIFRYIGRIAFPLFAYCLVLGFIHTKNLKKYALRLFLFGAVSQIPYWLCFFKNVGIFYQLNIGFTMLLGLYALYGIREKKYYHTVIALILSEIIPFEYGFYGICAMVAMYLFIFDGKGYFAFASAISLGYPLVASYFNGYFDMQCLAVLALPIMLISTRSKIKIPKIIGYGFYPAHLLTLWFIKTFII